MKFVKKITRKIPTLSMNPFSLGDVLFRKDKRIETFLALDQDKRVDLLRSVTTGVKKDILKRIPESDFVSILQTLDPDEATDMLQLVSKMKREKVLNDLSAELKDSLSILLV